MTPKEINRAAGRIFQAAVPPSWGIRSQQDQEDYGIDYEIELTTADDKATGFIFKVQEKGVEEAVFIENGRTLSYRDLSVARVTYYLSYVRLPVVLVIVDVSRARAYWTTIQGNPQLVESHREALSSNKQTMTVHIPAANVLPDTAGRVIEAVSRSNEALLLAAVESIRSDRLLDAARALGRTEELAEALTAHKEYAESAQIDSLRQQGRLEEARRLSWKYLESPAATLEMRFEVGLKLIQIASAGVRAGPDLLVQRGVGEYIQARTEVTSRLLRLARSEKASRPLRLFARALCRTVRLRKAADREFGFFMSTVIQQETGDDFTRFMTKQAQTSARREVLRELRKAQVALVRLGQGEGWWLLPQAWAQVVMDVPMFLASLQKDGLDEAAAGIVEWLDAIGELCIDVTARSKRWSELTLCSLMSVGLMGNNESLLDVRLAKARNYVARIEDPVQKAAATRTLDEYATLPAMANAVTEPSIESEVALYRTMAKSLGVDPDHPKNQVDEVVRIGLQDLNPERVLRQCLHLFVSLGSIGIPGQMLGLPTAGSKYVHCTKHSHTMGGLMLDGIWGMMSSRYCTKCPDRLPQPKEWRWTRAWQREQDQRWRVFADRTPG
jgi:hypothetical protein